MVQGFRWLNITTGIKMRLASEYCKDGVSISNDFKLEIAKHIYRHKPDVIVETGTYNGSGTTDAIIKGLVSSGHGGYLISIESDLKLLNQAKSTHARYESTGMVKFVHGVSLPKEWMPHTIDNDFPDDIFTDYSDPNQYLKEIPYGVKYDMLGEEIKKENGKIQMLVLDSAGHLGTAEFLYSLELIKSPCYIFLDDVFHRKHFKSMAIARSDIRCTILEVSREKFGHAIIHFKPKLQ